MMEFLREQWREAVVVSRREAALREGDERFVDGFRFVYTTQDHGETRPRHVVTAYDAAVKVGEMVWLGRTGEVWGIEVDPAYRRRGLATAMLEFAQEAPKKPKHSNQRTDDGEAWARSVGGPVPRRLHAAIGEVFSDGRIYESHTNWRAFVAGAKQAVVADEDDWSLLEGDLPLTEADPDPQDPDVDLRSLSQMGVVEARCALCGAFCGLHEGDYGDDWMFPVFIGRQDRIYCESCVFGYEHQFGKTVTASISKDAVRCTNAAFEAITGQCPSIEIIDGGHLLSLLKDAGFGYEVLGRVAPTVRALMVMPEFQSGSYYLFTSGHAMALVDGVLTDTEERGPDGRRIIGVYRVTKRPSVRTSAVRFSDFERGDRVEVRGYPGTVVSIHGQGNAYTKGYLQISFDSDPDRPAWYPWREVRKVGRTAMALPDFKRTDRDMSEKQFLSACKKILADVAKEMDFKGKLPEVVIQDLGGSSARSIDPGEMREFPNGAILVDPYDADSARQKDSGYSTFRVIAHEAIHALVQREMKSYAGSTQIITEGSAEILSVVYWAKNGPGYGGGGSKDLDAIHEQGYGWVGGDVALASRINYPEYIVEVMRRAASKVGWDQKRIVAEVKRIASSDRNGAIDWLRETSADHPLPGGMPKTAEGMLLWLVRGA